MKYFHKAICVKDTWTNNMMYFESIKSAAHALSYSISAIGKAKKEGRLLSARFLISNVAPEDYTKIMVAQNETSGH